MWALQPKILHFWRVFQKEEFSDQSLKFRGGAIDPLPLPLRHLLALFGVNWTDKWTRAPTWYQKRGSKTAAAAAIAEKAKQSKAHLCYL